MFKLKNMTNLVTKYGTFHEHVFSSPNSEIAIALCMGEVQNGKDILLRIHSSCISGHTFNSLECDCASQMERSQKKIASNRSGIIIWLDQEGRGNGYLAKAMTSKLKSDGLKQGKAYEELGFPSDNRDYNGAVDILHHFNIRSVVLLSSNVEKARALQLSGISLELVEI